MKRILCVLLVIMAAMPVLSQEMLQFKRTNGPYKMYFYDMQFNRANDIFLSVNDQFEKKTYFLKSTVMGESWIDLTENFPFEFRLFDIANGLDTSETGNSSLIDVIYAISNHGDSIAISYDGGDNWNVFLTGIYEDFVRILKVSPSGEPFITTNSWTKSPYHRFFRGDKRGKSWVELNSITEESPITALNFGGTNEILAISKDPTSDYHAIFFSSDNGDSWESIFNDFHFSSNYNNILIKEDMIILTDYRGLFKSTDKGKTWKRILNGLYYSTTYGIISDSKGNIYIDDNFGITKSTDDGESWSYCYINENQNRFFKINSADVIFYLNTMDMIYYSYKPILAVEPGDENSFITISPNPSHGNIQISANIPQSGNAKCSIINQIGSECGVLFNEYITQGSFNRSFNIEHLSPGMYFLKFEQGSNIVVKKIIKL